MTAKSSSSVKNKIYFQISSAGHEAVTAAMGLLFAARSRGTGFIRTIRDRALCLMLGVTPLEMLLAAVGAGGRFRVPVAGRCPRNWGASEVQRR